MAPWSDRYCACLAWVARSWVRRAEAVEAAAAAEIAVAAGDAPAEALLAVLGYADRFVAMMTGLIR